MNQESGQICLVDAAAPLQIVPTDDTDGHGNFSLQKLNNIVENYSKFILRETKIRHL
jgi:hypothetical protein